MSLLDIRGLTLDISGYPILHAIDLSVDAGQVLGIIGESGSGKSMTALSIMGVLPAGANVSGAITLAGVLTLPLVLQDGSPFPARQLAIFLAASVILVSLLVASVALPRLLRGLELPEEEDEQQKEDLAIKAASQAALEAVEKLRQRLVEDSAHAERYNAAANQVSQRYQRKLGAVDMADTDPEEAGAYEQALRQFRHTALVAERTVNPTIQPSAAQGNSIALVRDA